MACDVPRLECIHDHIKNHLREPKPNATGTGYRACCPAHDDHDPSLTISAGEKARIMWKCWAGCDPLRVRAELINDGVPPACLPLPKDVQAELVDRLEQIVTAPTKQDTAVRMQVLLALRGYEEPPRGKELVEMGAEIGIKRRQSFDWAAAIRASTTDQGRYSRRQARVKNSEVTPASRPAKVVRKSAPSAGTRTEKVRKSAQATDAEANQNRRPAA